MNTEDIPLKNALRATRLIFLAFGLGISAWAPMVPFVKAKLAVNDAELGFILFVFGIGALIAMPLAGYFVHKFGTRLIATVSSIFVCFLLPFLTIADTPWLVSFVLFIFGIGSGFWNVSINAHAVHVELRAQSAIMSGLHCFFSAGGLCGALIVSAMLELGFGLLLSASVVSVIMFAMIALNCKYLLPREEKQFLQSPKLEKKKFSLPGVKVFILGAACFFSFMVEGSMLDWSAEFLRSVLNYNPGSAGIGYALFSIGMVLGRYTGDALIRSKGTLFAFQGGCLVAASGLLAVISASWGALELAGFFLIGLGAANIVPILFSSSGRVTSSSPDINLTVVTTLGYLGLLFGPAFIGYVAQATTLSFAFLLISALLLIVGASGCYILKGLIPTVEKVNAPQ